MRGGPGHQHAHAWYLACSANRLLRARRQRPRGCRAAQERDELAPPHSMTSSARASSIGWHLDANRLGGDEVDDKIELGRLLHRDIGGLRSTENLVDKVACAPVQAWEVRRIGHETARFDYFAAEHHCGQPRGEREAINPNPVGTSERLTNNIKGLRATLEGLKGRCDIRHLPDFQRDGLDAERAGRGLDLFQFPHARRIVGIGHDRQLA